MINERRFYTLSNNNEKTMNVRMQQKHDFEANWLKATNFTPKAGEIIIYKAEKIGDPMPEGRVEPITYARIKYGDGTTNVNDLPFQLGLGQATAEGGEIFCDYENNTAELNGHAEGEYTSAGWRGHAEGYLTIADNSAHAEGRLSEASGKASHAEGYERNTNFTGTLVTITNNVNINSNQIVVNRIPSELKVGSAIYLSSNGDITFTPTDTKVVTAINTQTKTLTLHYPFKANNYETSGWTNPEIIPAGAAVRKVVRTTASGLAAHAEGVGTLASAYASHSEGQATETSGKASHAEGYFTKVNADYAHAEGQNTTTNGIASHAEGYKTKVDNNYGHAEGNQTISSGLSSHSEGELTEARGNNAHAQGLNTMAYGNQSHSEGQSTIVYPEAVIESRTEQKRSDRVLGAWNEAATASKFSVAFGANAHVEGKDCIAIAGQTHAEGLRTCATGAQGHTEGQDTIAAGVASHAEGLGTQAVANYSHVQGKYNDPEDANYAHIIGGGGKGNPKNIHTVDWSGNAWYAGDIYTSGGKTSKGKKLATEEFVLQNSSNMNVGTIVQLITWEEND